MRASDAMNACTKLLLRRQFFVDMPFQMRVIWRTLLLTCFLLAVVVVGLLLPIVRGIETPGGDRVIATDAATVFLFLHDNLWWVALVVLVLPTLAAVQHTHRIAGPMVRVRVMLRQLAEGKLPQPLYTRRNDYLKPEVALLNEAVAKLGERLQRMQQAHLELCRNLAAASDPRLLAEEVAVRLQAATATAAKLGAELQQVEPAAATAEPLVTAGR